MDISVLKSPGPGLEKIESLQQLRERLLKFMLQAAFIPATILYVVAMIPVFQKGLSLPPLVYTVIYIGFSIITFITRIPYLLRAGIWAGLFFLWGVINLLLSGFNVDSGLFFLTYILMSTLFFDLKQGLVALGVSLGSIAILGYIIVGEQIVLGLALPQTAPLKWIIGGMILVTTGLLLLFPLVVIMRNLVRLLEKARAESLELERINRDLRSSEERYRTLVEISPDLITLLDLQGNILITNQPDLDYYGYEGDDLLGNSYLSFITPEDHPIVLEAVLKTLETGSAKDVICHCIRKDGTLFDAEFDTALIRNKDGEPEAMIIMGRDITDRIIAERVLKMEKVELETRVVEKTSELKMANEMLQELVTRSPTVIYSAGLEPDSPITYISENVRHYTGYPPEDFISDPGLWRTLLHPEHVMDYEKWVSRIAETGEAVAEYRICTRKGEYRWMRDSARFVFSLEGKPMGVVGACIDITTLKQTQESYRTLVDQSIQGIAVFREECIVYGNQKMADSFGITLDELKSLTPVQVVNFLHPDDQDVIWNRYQSRLSGITEDGNHEIRLQQPGGEIRYLIVSTTPIIYEGSPALQVTAFDITEMKRMEQALRDSEETARAILNATTESLVLVNPEEVVLAANQSALQFTNVQPDEILGKTLSGLFPEELSRVNIHFTTLMETGQPIYFEEAYNGRLFDINLFPIFDDYGQVGRILIAGRDITEQRKMEKALRESEKTARVMMNTVPSAIALIDSKGTILAANAAAARRVGVDLESLPGRNAHLIFPDDKNSTHKNRLAAVFTNLESTHFEDFRDGRWTEVHIHPIPGEGGQVDRALVSAIDLTEHRLMEQALRESEETVRAMINATPSLMMMLDRDGRALAANQMTAQRLGLKLEDILGQVVYQLVPEDITRVRKAYIDEVFTSGLPAAFEDTRAGFWFENHAYPVMNEDGQVTRVVVSARDVTRRKQMEEALRESEATWRIMMNATSSVLGMVDADGILLAGNTTLANKLGMRLEDALGKSMYDLVPEDMARAGKIHIDRVVQTGQGEQYEDVRLGTWSENHVYPVKNDDGQVTRVVFYAIDLTERMLIEQSLKADKEELESRVAERTRELTESREQLRSLTTEMIASQEEERRRISRELHDEAGQALVSMKYSLEAILSGQRGEHNPIVERLTAAIHQIDETMEQIRFLAHSLRPPLLDIANLDLTLRDYCSEFSESTKLQVEYSGASLPSLTDQAELAFFRFLQEGLTNVVKHARATRAQVRLKRSGRWLSLMVVDNGIGGKNQTIQGQGHLGMQERFRVLDGQVRIRTGFGEGFIILARVPYKQLLKDEQQAD